MSRFKIRQKISQRLKTTKLRSWMPKVTPEPFEYALGNFSKTIDLATTTAAATFSGRNAAQDLAHAAQDSMCKDYTCLALDTVACGCDALAGVCAFVPGTFAGTTAVSYFCRKLRNECKKAGGLLGMCD